MFVSVVCDLGGEDSRAAVYALLPQYGFEKVQRACFESMRMSDKLLAALKRDIDKVTDYYDTVRIYQYPVEGKLAISTLSQNRWKRMLVAAPIAKQ
ncbi:MAG TPA: CRISPR-associated endonuclease Cas2 [Spirochaetaceae bacterium]|jgi:CRISPR-associated protein Cas2|nr:CRISPR-associated endonuclease Cas2 [Spirochaetaceae bacterium]